MATEHYVDNIFNSLMKPIYIPCDVIARLIVKHGLKLDAIRIKRKYYALLRKLKHTYGSVICNILWNELLLQDYIAFLKRGTIHPIYEIVNDNGQDILIRKRNNPDDSIIKVMSAEDCFSTLLKAHEDTMHGDVEAISRITEYNCQYPEFCISLLLQSCNVCNDVSELHTVQECKQIQTSKSLWKFVIHKKHKIRQFNYFFIYMEVFTKYTIIRPLMKISIEEVGLELMKIFSSFGVPRKILTPSDHENFMWRTLKMLALIDPDYKVPVCVCNDYLFDVASVIAALNKWSIKTQSPDWEIGCHIVQWKFNTTLRIVKQKANGEIMSGVPYNLFFGHEVNAFNHLSGDMVSEQLNQKILNVTTLESSARFISSKMKEKIIDLNIDESAAESIATCAECNEEFTIYTCDSCSIYLHYKCGTRIRDVHSKIAATKIRCAACTIK